MSQFDVHRYTLPGSRVALAVDLQNKLLEGLATRLIAPLRLLSEMDRPVLRLNPVVEIEGKRYFIALQGAATVRVKALGAKVASLENRRDEIVAAIDFLVTGV